MTNNIFVDESGDLTMFDKKGRSMLGKEGVSPVFMVGLAIIPKPESIRKSLHDLRRSLLADPYYKGIPSFKPDANKTAVGFHAKDDIPEVREKVFRLLSEIDTQIIIAVRRKINLIAEAKYQFEINEKKISEFEQYDNLVTCIFHGVLHRAEKHEIVFSVRRSKDRNTAFLRALEKARENFETRTHIAVNSLINIKIEEPRNDACLQVIDYHLWALYRYIVNREERYFDLLRDNYKLIMDLDDTRQFAHGAKYRKSNPLTIQKMMPVVS